jgi:hypothetical protein
MDGGTIPDEEDPAPQLAQQHAQEAHHKGGERHQNATSNEEDSDHEQSRA